MRFLSLFLSCILLVGMTSCSKQLKAPLQIVDPISVTPDEQWAVVLSPYSVFQSTPGKMDGGSFHARRGDILYITGCEYVLTGDDKEINRTLWYGCEQGWLPESAVAIYSNKLRAQTAASELH